MKQIIWMVAAVAAAGCKNAESSRGGMPSPEGGLAELAWSIEGDQVRLVAHEEGGKVVARAFFGEKVRELTAPVTKGDHRNQFELAADGKSAVFKVESRLGHGDLLDRTYAQIKWDAASHEPFVTVWSCADDVAGGGVCIGPDWTGLARPAAK